jgi:hypothetical protein
VELATKNEDKEDRRSSIITMKEKDYDEKKSSIMELTLHMQILVFPNISRSC